MAVTSQVGGSLWLGEFIIRDWQTAGLLKPSAVKAAITTVEARLVRRRLGHLSDYDLEQLKRTLQGLLGL
jgi:mRNA interferase MazF